jgi:hypothetical protein
MHASFQQRRKERAEEAVERRVTLEGYQRDRQDMREAVAAEVAAQWLAFRSVENPGELTLHDLCVIRLMVLAKVHPEYVALLRQVFDQQLLPSDLQEPMTRFMHEKLGYRV